ncbi:MAG TPA: glutamyl-tRNA reductase [Armatimonadota bacterium]|jgi:glutamyl-tRNA reductase
MHLIVLGLSHKTAPVAVRELVALTPARIPEALMAIRRISSVREAAIISTCNRTELYVVSESRDEELLADILCHGEHGAEARDHLYSYLDEAMVRHLFRVASGVDSMVLGEGQILGQVREAARFANEESGAGPVLRRLFDQAISCGRRVRTETDIARGAVSVSHVAVELARQIFGDLKGRTVLLLGAGETAEMTARLMVKFGVSFVTVANRTFERAEALATVLGGQAVRYDQFPEKMERADVVVCSTAAPHAIITRDVARQAAARRRGRPVFLIDLAIPRDVEPSVADLDNVFLYNLDNLQDLVSQNVETRRDEIHLVEQIVEQEVASYMQWVGSLQVVPVLTELQRRFEDIRQAEMERTRRRLEGLTPDERDAVDQMTRAMVKKMLHDPWRFMRSSDESGTAGALQALVDVFGLELSGTASPLPTVEIIEPEPLPTEPEVPVGQTR